MSNPRRVILGCIGLLLFETSAALPATICPPASSLLLEVRREAQVTHLHPARNTVTTVAGSFVCRNALGTITATASASAFAIAPDVSVARAVAPALGQALNAALNASHVGVLTSCSLPAPEGSSEYFTIVWHGRGTRTNTFAIGIGFSELYPRCGAGAEALLAALRAYEAGLPLAPGAEVYAFPR